MHWPADALETHFAKSLRLPPSPGRGELSVGIAGQQHLPTVSSGQQPARPVQNRPEVVAGARLDLAYVDRHPHEQGRLTPFPGSKRELDLPGCCGRCVHVRERDVDPVPNALDHLAALSLDRLVDDPVMLGHRRAHRRGVQLPEHRRVLDVRKQERERLHLRLDLEEQRRIVAQYPTL